MDNFSRRAERALNNTVPFPPLGPAFVSADDAACWAHLQIGAQRDREYGGVIVQGTDGRFRATVPKEGEEISVDFALFLSTDEHGAFQVPAGFVCHACYHSHPSSEAQILAANPGMTKDQASVANSFFSVPDIIFTLRNRAFARAHYLSGPGGVLLKYLTSGFSIEALFYQALNNQWSKGTPIELDGSFEGMIRRLAMSGELQVLIANGLWGGVRGRVPDSWTMNTPVAIVPMSLMLNSPVFPAADLAVAYAQSRIRQLPNTRQLVFLFKHDRADEYLATEPLVIGRSRLPPDNAFPMLPLGPSVPSGFHLHGIFYMSRPVTAQFPTIEPWLYQQFFSPADLASYIGQVHKFLHKIQASTGLSLYMRTKDGALLKYRFSGSDAEFGLSRINAAGMITDDGTQERLLDGTLTPHQFIRRVAAFGVLSVEQTSPLWDVLGVVGQGWISHATFARPQLSLSFLSADDAARHLHSRVNGRRKTEFGALVLKRADQRYVATALLETGANPFGYERFYPNDSSGAMIGLPEGHEIVAWFGSHMALSKMDVGLVESMKWTRQDAELYAQMYADFEAYSIHRRQLPGYLSGAEDSLIVLEPTGTGQEVFELWFEASLSGKSSISINLANGTYTPADVARKLAEVSRLRVLAGNPLWGPARQLSLNWKPFEALLEYAKPSQITYGAVFNDPDSAVLDASKWALQSLDGAERYFAFLLKHEEKNEYVMSERVPVTWNTALFSLTTLFTLTAPATYSLPPGFYFEALYYCSGDTSNWPARHFIPPRELYQALEVGKTVYFSSGGGLPLYFTTSDQALLKYQPAKESPLFTLQDGDSGSGDIERKLSGGTLDGPDFARKVANAGELDVVQTSPCWGRLGRVSNAWQPYANLQRNNLGPVFIDMDDAARYVQDLVGTARLQRYGGFILMREDGYFFATLPRVVLQDDFQLSWIFPDEITDKGLYPPRVKVVARYYSQPATELPFLLPSVEKDIYCCMFSTRAVNTAVQWPYGHLTHYLLAPDGALLSLQPRDISALVAEHQVPDRAEKDWLQSPVEKKLRSGELAPSDYVKRIAMFFDFWVITGSVLWGVAGRVLNWAPNLPREVLTSYERATQDPALSPLFTQPADAVRHVHQQPRNKRSLTFGFVLKSTSNGHYVASLPVTDDGSLFAHRRVFSIDGYPYRYGLAGVYFCVPENPDFYPSGTVFSESQFAGIFSPVDMANALSMLRLSRDRLSLPVYVSCADGALLRFQLKESAVGIETYGGAQKTLREIRFRNLSASGYIQHLVAVGDLDVLVSSKNWLGQGRVGPRHRLRTSLPTHTDNRLPLGPIFTHPDDAAQYAQKHVDAFSLTEYTGAVLKHAMTDSYVPVEPLRDGPPPPIAARTTFRFIASQPATELPSGYEVFAAHQFYHTGMDQPAEQPEDNFRLYFVSWREVGFYTYTLKMRGYGIQAYYLSSRDGALLKYEPNYSGGEFKVFDTQGKWSEEGGYTAKAPKPSAFISALARNSVLEVLRFGTFWRPRGRVDPVLRLEIMSHDDWRLRDEL
ncbi:MULTISPECIES: DUF4329 domain-containing protein [unclassified Pseudomonas]|uniref:DUF4329 domain-containing protein n=1 Tax=unclassified Pseudomonas TaxID=196821 RepID=UPI002AC92D48|nr:MULTISPECIES: DUF4329 domain-containing protein [unclassified Pseudomonas]MEB0046496.1 DUF4329 domain-containing protein [Pseudomonas sp. Dout3]MEB0097922.1 DUF4329 domain-containing protein [Pseudomonas sp. DC1.2]WPX59550.1 DUF4329 domain-containing protein [Pseudomonas sp. DC1.2]